MPNPPPTGPSLIPTAPAPGPAPTPAVCIGPISVATGELTTTNDALAERFGRPPEVIFRKLGIHSRPLAAPETEPRHLAIRAARPLFENPAFAPSDLSLIITSSSSVNQVCPPVSCEVLAAIAEAREGVPPVMAFDIMATCPGWLYALTLACDHLHQPANRARTALLITTEMFTQGLDPEDFGSWASFGDAATATLVYGPDAAPAATTAAGPAASSPELRIARPLTFAYPDTVGALWGPPIRTSKYLTMNGPAMRAESMPAMARSLRAALEAGNLSIDDLDMLLAHQSNQRILADLAAELSIDPARVPTNLPYRGNTSSCALPLLIHDIRTGLVPDAAFTSGQVLGLTTFGGGFVAASAVGEVV